MRTVFLQLELVRRNTFNVWKCRYSLLVTDFLMLSLWKRVSLLARSSVLLKACLQKGVTLYWCGKRMVSCLWSAIVAGQVNSTRSSDFWVNYCMCYLVEPSKQIMICKLCLLLCINANSGTYTSIELDFLLRIILTAHTKSQKVSRWVYLECGPRSRMCGVVLLSVVKWHNWCAVSTHDIGKLWRILRFLCAHMDGQTRTV